MFFTFSSDQLHLSSFWINVDYLQLSKIVMLLFCIQGRSLFLCGCYTDSLLDSREKNGTAQAMLAYLEGIKLSPHICILITWLFFQRFFVNKSEIATAAEGNRGSCSSNNVCFLILFQTFPNQLFVTLSCWNLFSCSIWFVTVLCLLPCF